MCKNGFIASIPLLCPLLVGFCLQGRQSGCIFTQPHPGPRVLTSPGCALVWLAIFWTFVGVGFLGFDLHNYLHEQPAVPTIVHIHAIATTIWLLTATALVLLVETGNVRWHRSLGWFAAGYAALCGCDCASESELSWQALNLKTPGALPPAIPFLSLSSGSPLHGRAAAMWRALMRRNSAAHRRVLILADYLHQRCGFFADGEPLSAGANQLSGYLPVLRGRQSAASIV